MKVAVTSRGSVLSSELDPRFGRARYFVVVDTDSGEFTAHDNVNNRQVSESAEIEAGHDIVNLRVDAVITGNVGPKAAGALRAGNVMVYKQNWGTVRDAIEWYRTGRISEFAVPAQRNCETR
jgi:predicted Fe-Mo cluster-binding NifX family protein